MTTMSRKEALSLFTSFRYDVERACDATGAERYFAELDREIRKDERHHMAFGRRLVGSVKRKITRDQTVAYFVTRTIVEALAWFDKASGGDHKHTLGVVTHVLSLRRDYQLALAIVLNGVNVNGDYQRHDYKTRTAILAKLPPSGALWVALEQWGYDKLVK